MSRKICTTLLAGGCSLSVCLMVMLCLPGSLLANDDACDPKPTEGDFVLPMPEGLKMVFRSVFLGVGDGDFAAREIKLGDRAGGGFKEYPTVVVLGGSFLLPAPGGANDWAYYIGKYEVSEAQYFSIMNSGKKGGSNPVTMITLSEARQFVSKYNNWLNEEAPEALPLHEDARGFIRLPTEAEWEFAARGGTAVEPEVFDRRHPYSQRLARYEWFSGPSSSHDKIKKIGRLPPNPLGLHDMLGNVSEMTETLYQVEYVQGRTGGYVVRGGTFRTPEARLRSSLRTEAPFYTPARREFKQDELGIRLVIASPVYAGSQTSRRLEEAWDTYRITRPTPGPATAATGTTAGRTTYQMEDALRSLERLEQELERAGGVSEDARAQLGLLKSSFGDMRSIVSKAEQESAAAWTRMGSFTAWFLSRELRKQDDSMALLESARKGGDADEVELFEERHANLLANIRDASAQYGLVMQELGKISREQVLRGFSQYESHLIKLGAADQIRMHRLVISQYEEYARDQRLNMDAWRARLSE